MRLRRWCWWQLTKTIVILGLSNVTAPEAACYALFLCRIFMTGMRQIRFRDSSRSGSTKRPILVGQDCGVIMTSKQRVLGQSRHMLRRNGVIFGNSLVQHAMENRIIGKQLYQ